MRWFDVNSFKPANGESVIGRCEHECGDGSVQFHQVSFCSISNMWTFDNYDLLEQPDEYYVTHFCVITPLMGSSYEDRQD